MIDIQRGAQGICFTLKARPGAKRNSVEGIHNGMLKVSVVAPPEDGKANRAIVELLSEAFSVSRRTIQIVRGSTSSTKTIEITEMDDERLRELLTEWIAASEKDQA